MVYVGMSGGVDSSVAAALLKRGGTEVVGVFIKSWDMPGFPCDWREDRRDAMRVAARLGIPLVTLDLTAEYQRTVINYLVREYRVGRTPNPDVECNRAIKFGVFLSWALERGADFVATGHYARIRRHSPLTMHGQNGKCKTSSDCRLLRAKDENKDQTYFLWTLAQEQLARCLFPVGEYTKPEVRRLAKRFGLSTAEKKDSQGLCFVGKIDVKEFLKKYIKPHRGEVLDEKGKVIGYHDGAAFYTIGERHGFVATRHGDSRPYYVVAKEVVKNILVVSQTPPALESKAGRIILSRVNWISGERPVARKTCLARIRHRGELTSCWLNYDGDVVEVLPQQTLVAVAAGQSLVLYDRQECLGGGVIDRVEAFY